MTDRGKWLFWGSLILGFTLLAVPSTLLLKSVLGYRNFLSGLEPATLRQMTPGSFHHDDGARSKAGQGLPKIKFVTFRLRAPKAKSVSVIGEFNAWKGGTFVLNRESRGWWQAGLALPVGRYHYLFLVDGKPMLDPNNRESEETDGRWTSLKIVK
jgi:1,4-alpha-glucan branching enzyme